MKVIKGGKDDIIGIKNKRQWRCAIVKTLKII